MSKVYVITSGSYSDYSILGLVRGEPGQDLFDLLRVFHEETDKPVEHESYDPTFWSRKSEWLLKLSVEYELVVNGNAAQESYLFIEWLVRHRGFQAVEYEEINLE